MCPKEDKKSQLYLYLYIYPDRNKRQIVQFLVVRKALLVAHAIIGISGLPVAYYCAKVGGWGGGYIVHRGP